MAPQILAIASASRPKFAASMIVRSASALHKRNSDRVLHAIGLEPRAPFPKGHIVEQGDWSLLDPVRTRPPFWRDDRAV